MQEKREVEGEEEDVENVEEFLFFFSSPSSSSSSCCINKSASKDVPGPKGEEAGKKRGVELHIEREKQEGNLLSAGQSHSFFSSPFIDLCRIPYLLFFSIALVVGASVVVFGPSHLSILIQARIPLLLLLLIPLFIRQKRSSSSSLFRPFPLSPSSCCIRHLYGEKEPFVLLIEDLERKSTNISTKKFICFRNSESSTLAAVLPFTSVASVESHT